ncbi:MAG: hypothetical protein HC907_19880 [Richelia sp. SM1_7_0]|nr:hypothetical protein [Richelia sp. SM1_7_0]
MPKFSQEEREVLKNRAFELLAEGHSEREVITRLNISSRTLRRWFKNQNVTFTTKQRSPEPEPDTPTVEVVPAVERIGTDVDRQGNIEVTITSRTAIRLLNLAESAINAVGNTLRNPDSSDVSRIRAAELAGRWTGLQNNDKSTFSILGTIGRKSGVSSNLTNDETEIDLVPTMLQDRKDHQRKEAERRQREAEKAQQIARELAREKAKEETLQLIDYYLNANPPFDYQRIRSYPEFEPELFFDSLDVYADVQLFTTILEDLYRLEMVSQELYNFYIRLYSNNSVDNQQRELN